jgi:predicted O-methyltransferase YrrM
MIEEDKARLEENKRTCSWFGSYGIVPHLIEMVGAKKILEIGVAYGYHADYLCKLLPDIKYIGVDPYEANYDLEDIFCQDVQKLFDEESVQRAMDRLFSAVTSNLSKLDGKAQLIREKSWIAANRFADESFDLVYIDGDHTYECVCKDLAAWYPKVRKGGVICGDDIGWPGVKKAVDEFFLALGTEYQIVTKNGFESMPAFYFIVN